MGQYFAPVIIDQRENPTVMWWFKPHVYGSGQKLMEHSYVGNGFVRAVETILRLDGGLRVVWAGDYADEEPDGRNLWKQRLRGTEEDFSRCVVVPSGVQAPYAGYEERLSRIVAAGHVVDVPLAGDDECRYVLNVDTRQYVDTTRAPLDDPESWDARVHPLPLLTCEGNNRGGGDYDSDAPVIGSWARCRVSVSGDVPAGFDELDFAAALRSEQLV